MQSAFNDTYMKFENGALLCAGFLAKTGAFLWRRQLKEAASNISRINFMPIALQKNSTQFTIIPRGDTGFSKKKTQVYFITAHKKGVSELYKLTGMVKRRH